MLAAAENVSVKLTGFWEKWLKSKIKVFRK
jgi:hypothetical protein